MDPAAILRRNFASGSTRTNATVGARTSAPKARDAFLNAKPWQFGRDGRKFKLVAERMRRLSRALARFDRSGACRSVYPSVDTILARLRSAELHYPPDGAPWLRRMAWSRRTVFVYLKRLERKGISTASGLSSYHGTKRRELHPERLLSAPSESCTPRRRESCTGSKSLDSKKVHRSRTKQHHPDAQKTRDDAASHSHRSGALPEKTEIPQKPSLPVEKRSKAEEAYEKRIALFSAVARRNILLRTTETPESVWWVLRTVQQRAALAGTFIRSPGYFETGFDEELAQDAERAGKYFNSAELIAAMSANRHRIACLQLAVEEAVRSGRRAAEILAERLAP